MTESTTESWLNWNRERITQQAVTTWTSLKRDRLEFYIITQGVSRQAITHEILLPKTQIESTMRNIRQTRCERPVQSRWPVPVIQDQQCHSPENWELRNFSRGPKKRDNKHNDYDPDPVTAKGHCWGRVVWWYRSVVEHLPSKKEALGLILRTLPPIPLRISGLDVSQDSC